MSQLHLMSSRWTFFVAMLVVLPLSAATRTVTNTNDAGPGSFRQAILDAQGGDRIEFAIGSGPQTIQPLSDLPANGSFVTIDGTTQPGYAGKPLIELTGNYPLTNVGLYLNGEVIGLVINGFEGAGIAIGMGAVRGCYIGTDRTGKMALPNGNAIFLRRVTDVSAVGEVTVGGPNPGDGNLISGNEDGVVQIDSVPALSVQGNIFGSDIDQTVALGSAGYHIGAGGYNPPLSRIGNEAPNVFVGATGSAVTTSGASVVFGNFFGVTPGGIVIPNRIGFTGNGSNAQVIGNTFKGNTLTATRVGDGLGVQIRFNTMENNGFGIDLGGELGGPAHPNDDSDTDYGPNHRINYPVLGRAKIVGDRVLLTGSISVPATRLHIVDLYANSVCNAWGHGEGRDFIEGFELMTDAAGRASFERTLPLMPAGTVITATTTSDFEGTSEFSACIIVEGPGVFAFEGAAANASETGNATVTVRRKLGAAGAASVSYSVIGGTATPGVDFTGGSGTLTFADDETTKTITIPLVNDTIHEAIETIQLQLSNATAGTSVGSPETTTIAITSDDGLPGVRIRAAETIEGNAGTTSVQVPFWMPWPSSAPQTFVYTTNPGSAGPDDFVQTTASVTFQPGETEKVVTLQVVGDTRYEPNEQFQVASAPSFAAVTIVNDDSYPTVAVQNVSVVEGNAATSTLFVTIASSGPVRGLVSLSVSDQTAVAGRDYEAANHDLFFDNQTTRTVAIAIVGDTTVEATETFRISLQKIWGDFNVNPQPGTVTILDDDMGVTPTELMIASGQTGEFVVHFGAPLEADALFTITSDAPHVVSVPSTVLIRAGSATALLEARALVPGHSATIRVTSPPAFGGIAFEVRVLTYEKATLHFSPQRLELIEGGSGEVSVSIDPPKTTALTIGLTSVGAASAPASITIPAAGSATFPVRATGIGAFSIDAHLPPEHGEEVQSLPGYVVSSRVSVAPRINSIHPATGATSGGTLVRVNGDGFDSSCWLFFGSRAAESVLFRDGNTLTATSPWYATAAVDVTVRCTNGEFTAAAAFEYRAGDDPAPIVTSVEPSAAAPGELVTIRGLHFRADHVAAIAAVRATVVDALHDALVIRLTELPPGLVPITVTDKLGRTSTTGPVFRVLETRPVRIDAVAPLTVAAGGELELRGEGFRPGLTFRMAGHNATIVALETTHAILRVPSGVPSGPHVVQVRNDAGELETASPIVTIAGRLLVSTIDPRCSTTNGGLFVTIRGHAFTSGATVRFDDAPATEVSLLDATALRVRVPAGIAGPARVTVIEGTRTATLSNGFIYESPYAPRSACAGRVRSARP